MALLRSSMAFPYSFMIPLALVARLPYDKDTRRVYLPSFISGRCRNHFKNPSRSKAQCNVDCAHANFHILNSRTDDLPPQFSAAIDRCGQAKLLTVVLARNHKPTRDYQAPQTFDLQAYAIRKDELPRAIVFHHIVESMAQEQ